MKKPTLLYIITFPDFKYLYWNFQVPETVDGMWANMKIAFVFIEFSLYLPCLPANYLQIFVLQLSGSRDSRRDVGHCEKDIGPYSDQSWTDEESEGMANHSYLRLVHI